MNACPRAQDRGLRIQESTSFGGCASRTLLCRTRPCPTQPLRRPLPRNFGGSVPPRCTRDLAARPALPFLVFRKTPKVKDTTSPRGLKLQPSQPCSCRRCQTCRMRPEASPPHQSRPRITAAYDQPPIPRCSPLPTAASTPQPATLPPLNPPNRDYVLSHRNPAAPPLRWIRCGNPPDGTFDTRISSQTPGRALHAASRAPAVPESQLFYPN